MKNNLSKILLSLAIFVFGVLACFAFLDAKGYIGNNKEGNGSCYTKCENKVTVTDKGIADAVDKVYDAVVIVESYQQNKLTSTGTGFIYKVNDNYGYIITNYHVINGNTTIKITMADGTSINAKYLGGEQYLDIAVLAIPKANVTKVVEIGNSETLRVGDTVFTVGTPVDLEYRGTVTRGILSGKDRLVSFSISGSRDDYVVNVLQTDAAINPGNSGGPLLNSNGEVVGVNSLKLVEDSIEGMGFAMPIEYVMNNITALEKGQIIERPFIGISMANVNDEYNLYKANINVSEKITSGVVVLSIVENSSASGKLQKGDVITKINGKDVNNVAYLRYELYKNKVGDKINITYMRDSKEYSVKVTLTKSN